MGGGGANGRRHAAGSVAARLPGRPTTGLIRRGIRTEAIGRTRHGRRQRQHQKHEAQEDVAEKIHGDVRPVWNQGSAAAAGLQVFSRRGVRRGTVGRMIDVNAIVVPRELMPRCRDPRGTTMKSPPEQAGWSVGTGRIAGRSQRPCLRTCRRNFRSPRPDSLPWLPCRRIPLRGIPAASSRNCNRHPPSA